MPLIVFLFANFNNFYIFRRFYNWIKLPSTFSAIKEKFEETSSYAKLIEIQPNQEGYKVFLRFVSKTGDAMGMNMISKACENAIKYIQEEFKTAEFRSLSSNLCTDKKAAAINWINGRGKSVISAVTIKAENVRTQLHTTVDKMVNLCKEKCSDGSAMAVTIGGGNAQAANVVAAIFLAAGQDAAQVITSSMCMTTMEKTDSGDLRVSCTMKCLEVGTVGGGTILPAQKNALKVCLIS